MLSAVYSMPSWFSARALRARHIVLGHHHVAGAQQVHQGKVHAVRPLGEHQRLRALPLKAVGGIAED